MEFKTFIKNLRNNLNISQEEAANRIGVSISTIQNWERGDNKPDMNSISNIAKVYKIKVSEILYLLAQELDPTCIDNTETETNKLQEYIKVMPSNLDFSPLDGLEFTYQEQQLFLILALSIECNGDPISSMYNETKDYFKIALFFDKLQKYNLYISNDGHFHGHSRRDTPGDIYSRNIKLSERGAAIFNIIKSSNNKIFNINSVDFNAFLNICFIFNIDKEIVTKIKLIKMLAVDNSCYLNKFVKSTWYGKEQFDEKNTTCPITSLATKKSLEEYLGSDYYTVIEEEYRDELYLLEKDMYLKKLEFYEQNKDLNEGLIEPKKFQERIYKKAVPTQKTLDFLKLLNS